MQLPFFSPATFPYCYRLTCTWLLVVYATHLAACVVILVSTHTGEMTGEKKRSSRKLSSGSRKSADDGTNGAPSTMADALYQEAVDLASSAPQPLHPDPELQLLREGERESMRALCESVAPAIAAHVAAAGGAAHADVTGAGRVLRFLRAYEHDAVAAAAAYVAMLSQRRDQGIEGVRERVLAADGSPQPCCGESMPHAEEAVAAGYGVSSMDDLTASLCCEFRARDGHMVMISRDGLGSPQALIDALSTEQLTEFWRSFFELRQIHMDGETRASGRQLRTVTVRDLAGLGIGFVRHAAAVSALQSILKDATANYPESTHVCMFVNTPGLFSGIFALIKPILSERTQAKVAFATGPEEYRPLLLAHLGVTGMLAAHRTLSGIPRAEWAGGGGQGGGQRELVVPARDCLEEVVYCTDACATVKWSWSVAAQDVEFEVERQFWDAGAREVKRELVHPLVTVAASDECTTGAFKVEAEALLVLRFNNTASWFAEKNVTLSVTIEK